MRVLVQELTSLRSHDLFRREPYSLPLVARSATDTLLFTRDCTGHDQVTLSYKVARASYVGSATFNLVL